MTSDLEPQRADLDRFGYRYLENALPSDQRKARRLRLEEQAAAELKLGHLYEGTGEGGAGVIQRLWFLLNKGKPFRNLLKPDPHALTGHLLGEDCLHSSFTAVSLARAASSKPTRTNGGCHGRSFPSVAASRRAR